MEDTPPSATQPKTQAAGMPPKPERKGSRNTLVQASRVLQAVTSLATGKAKTKAHAAQLAGVSPQALMPSNLATVLNSHHVSGLLSLDPLDVTGLVEGKRMSLRDALSGGMESAISTIGTLRAKVGKLSKDEREALTQAERWLKMCRENGLWRTPVNVPAGGIMPIAPREPEEHEIEGSAPWYLRDMSRHQPKEGSTELGGIPAPDPVSASNPA